MRLGAALWRLSLSDLSQSDASAGLKDSLPQAAQTMKMMGMSEQEEELKACMNQAADKVGVPQQYNSFSGQAAAFGVVDAKSANVEN